MRKIDESKTYSTETPCGTIYVTVVSAETLRVFIHMGKAGGCAGAMLAGIEWGINTAITAGISMKDIVQGLGGISCNQEHGEKISCCATVSSILRGILADEA